MDNFDEILDSLPPLNPSCQNLLRELQGEDSTAQKVEQMLLKDPVISARTLHLANSSFYGFSGKVSSLKQAYIILGKDTLSNLVTSLYLLDQFSKEKTDHSIDGYDSVWKHSLFSGILFSSSSSLFADDGFIISLFQYIGLLAIGMVNPGVLEDLKAKEASIDTMEQVLMDDLGIDLTKLNIEILSYWKLPLGIIEGMKTIQNLDSNLSKELRVCKFIASAMGYRPLGFTYSRPISKSELELIANTTMSLSLIIKKASESFYEINQIIN